MTEDPWKCDDLCARLSWWAFEFCDKGEREDMASDDMSEAVARIQTLEMALKKIAKHDLQAIAIDALRPGKRVRTDAKR
tara:strand:+ start:189 stop:425 length:237 start_codon:yes stop_codon:yes gene_type:complete